jgi:hypothetical protein
MEVTMSQSVASARELIVSRRGLEGFRMIESANASSEASRLDPIAVAMVINRYRNVVRKLEHETAASEPDVMVTVADRETSLLQSRIAEEATAAQPLGPGGLEVKFGTGFAGGDWFRWALSTFDWIDRKSAHDLIRPSSTTPMRIPNRARIGMAGDWGTGLYGAPVIAGSLARTGPYDVLMHLGDVYYSGTPKEIEERFIALWPASSAPINRALNSNHEMYSGGFGYFDSTLKAFGQESSYFAMQNQHWLLIGLDTAYVDHDMDDGQVGWVNQVAKNAGTRKIVLFSHQQLFSRLSSQGPHLNTTLKPLLESKRVAVWYWGHEHQCVIYDRHPSFGLLGRCLGNGGIPEARVDSVKDSVAERTAHGASWKRLSSTADSPSCLVLDGRNEYITNQEDRFAPHGYMTIEFDGPSLTERVFLPDGEEIFVNQIA